MKLTCPGCQAKLAIDDGCCREKVLVQCPDCLYVFLARAGEEPEAPPASAKDEPAGEATLLTSDFTPKADAREFQWNVKGASLTVISGDNQGFHIPLKGKRLVVGRKGADLVIEDKAVSREHCEFYHNSKGWWVADLKSKNGTFIGGKKIENQKLAHLDEVRVGQTVILFAEAEAPGEKPHGVRAPEEAPDLDVTRADPSGKDKVIPLPEGREFYLEHMGGSKKGRSYKFAKSRVIVGRGEEADLRIDDRGASRKHAMIEVYSRDQVYITDLASQNGTWLNGMKIKSTRLIHGDLVRLGNLVLKFVVQDLP